jgi:hypothetical protein
MTALELIAAGYAVFPIRPMEKRPPLVKGGFYAATTDEHQVKWWWNTWPRANIAARTGGDWAVVDVDPRSGGTLEAVDALGLPRNTRSLTTPGRGWQFHYRVNGPVKSRSGALAAGIDVKGELAYVLLPPSVRADGVYAWINGLDTPMLEVDAALLNQAGSNGGTGARGTRVERKRPEEVREGELHGQAMAWCAWFAAAGYELDEVEELTWQLVERFKDPVYRGDKGVEAIIEWITAKELKNQEVTT